LQSKTANIEAVAEQAIRDRDRRQRMALDVHIAEYNAIRQLLNIQIQQDRISLSFGVTLVGAVIAAIGTLLSRIPGASGYQAVALIAAAAPALLSMLGIMNARSIQAGIEANAYVVLHLKPEISKVIDDETLTEPLLRSEEFFPRVDRLHELKPGREVSEPGKNIRRWSGAARVGLFLIPSITCLIGAAWYVVSSVAPKKYHLPDNSLEWVIVVILLTSGSFTAVMIHVYRVLYKQLMRFEELTQYSLVHPGNHRVGK